MSFSVSCKSAVSQSRLSCDDGFCATTGTESAIWPTLLEIRGTLLALIYESSGRKDDDYRIIDLGLSITVLTVTAYLTLVSISAVAFIAFLLYYFFSDVTVTS